MVVFLFLAILQQEETPVIHAGNIGSQAVKTANQLQAFTGDDFTGGNHYIKAIKKYFWMGYEITYLLRWGSCYN